MAKWKLFRFSSISHESIETMSVKGCLFFDLEKEALENIESF